MYTVHIQPRECRKLLTNSQPPQYFLADAILGFIYIQIHHPAIHHGKNWDLFNVSLIDDRDSDIPSPLIMYTCTGLHHAPPEWQTNKVDHSKVSKSKRTVDRPDHSYCFIYMNDGGKNAPCCIVMGHKQLTSPGVADMYTFLMNTWNTLPSSYQQKVYKNTFGTAKGDIQRGGEPHASSAHQPRSREC
jgi:hypothetical protein